MILPAEKPDVFGEPVPCGESAALQSEFLARMGPNQQVRQLFEHLPGIYFFMKDKQSRMICASRPILDRLGLRDESEIVGTTDYDYFPPQIAGNFVRDDRRVMRTSQPLTNHVEIWYGTQRVLDWFVTNKLPVLDADGRTIGVMGTVHSYEGKRRSLLPFSRIDPVVQYIREHHQRKISLEELSDLVGLSPRHLQRTFREAMGINIQDFLTKTRIQAASDALLRSNAPVSVIALEFGFCDQSAFTKHFRQCTGLTPLKFRKRFATPLPSKGRGVSQ